MLSQCDLILMSGLSDRRSTPRLPAFGRPARIAWKEGGLRVCKAPARLIDITANGAGLLAARSAKPVEVLWLGITSLPWEWVKATVRGASPLGTRRRYHIIFCEPCPVGLLEEALGLSERNQEVPSIQVLWDHDIDEYTWVMNPRL